MRWARKLDTRHQRSHGGLEEPCRVFLGFREVVHTEQDKERSETCVEVVACLLPPRSGGDGTGRWTWTRKGMLLRLHWQHPPFRPWFLPEATVSRKYQRYPWCWKTLWRPLKRHRLQSSCWRESELTRMSRRSEPAITFAPVRGKWGTGGMFLAGALSLFTALRVPSSWSLSGTCQVWRSLLCIASICFSWLLVSSHALRVPLSIFCLQQQECNTLGLSHCDTHVSVVYQEVILAGSLCGQSLHSSSWIPFLAPMRRNQLWRRIMYFPDPSWAIRILLESSIRMRSRVLSDPKRLRSRDGPSRRIHWRILELFWNSTHMLRLRGGWSFWPRNSGWRQRLKSLTSKERLSR